MADCSGRRKFIIRTSDRSYFRTCRLKWDFTSKLRQDLEPKSPQTFYDFGTSIHKGLEAYYDPRLWGKEELRQLAARTDFFASERAFRQSAKADSPYGDLPFEQDQEFDNRTALGGGMLEHYFLWAPKQDNFKPVKTEIEFEVKIPVPEDISLPNGFYNLQGNLFAFCREHKEVHPVVYQGRVDLLVEDEHGFYWIVDHKTAAQFGNTAYLDVDDQCGSYIWALRRVLHLPIRGVLYNRLLKAAPHPPAVLKNGGLSQNKQQRTTYDLFLVAMQEHNQPYGDYAEYLDYLKNKPNGFFSRVPVHRGDEEDKTTERRILMEAIDMLNDPSIYPNPGMFICMGCAFMQPCVATADGSDLKWIMDSLYRKRVTNEHSDRSDEASGASENRTDTDSTNDVDSGRPEGSVRL